mgnify:CR=1 FL=1
MYRFVFNYFKNPSLEYSGIVKATQTDAVGTHTVEGDNLLTFDYQTVFDIHLFAKDRIYKISHQDLKSIEVEKEAD